MHQRGQQIGWRARSGCMRRQTGPPRGAHHRRPAYFEAAGAGVAGTGAGSAPGMAPVAGAGALAAGAAFSSTLLVSGRPTLLDMKAKVRVARKKTVAQAAVERDRKLALPVAPNKLPEEPPPPKDAPISAPLPCWINTRPIITKADKSCSARIKVIQICMIEETPKK